MADLPDIIVPGYGPRNSTVMLVGEAPGEEEANAGRPFVGRAGQEQDRYLRNAGLSRHQIYMTNLVKRYLPGNPDPTPALIDEWGPRLQSEINLVRPTYIIPVGRFATRFFLGDVDMDMVHGIPHAANGHVILPCYHPAAGFYNDDTRPLIAYDYQRAGEVIRTGRWFSPVDEFASQECYIDVDWEFDFNDYSTDVVGYDTEGDPTGYWGDVWWQVSFEPGTAFVFRRNSPYFETNVARFAYWLQRRGVTIAIHNAMHDYAISRSFGLDLFDIPIFDTQYAAYLLRVEPQGLKPLAYRHCGMRMASYEETVGDAGLQKQLTYLSEILDRSPWPKPEPELEYGNDGSCKLKVPQPVERRAEAILADYYSGKLDKDGERTDPHARWRKTNRQLRRMVESTLGAMPIGHLGDLSLEDGVHYAGRDPDATLRLYHRLRESLRSKNLLPLMNHGMAVYPIFEEMQATGMLAKRAYFENLGAEMWDRMCEIQSRISHRYFQGRPFNPASSTNVATLMRRRGLVGEKRTSTGKVSTGKKSVEHLRHTDDAMADVINWREHQKIKDSFCGPFIEAIGEAEEARIFTTIKTTRTASRRISSSNPNLTAVPVRHELGLRVRRGFTAPEGCLIGSWDLSQIEMRYMAHLSRDPLLVRFFHEGRDVHAETAARIFGIRLDDVREMEHRYPAKRAGFGIITNIQGPGLLDQLRMFGCEGWDERKCDKLIKEWLKVYKGVAKFLDDTKREVQQHGIVRDEWGHIRYLPGVWSEDFRVKGEAERAASSHKIQGGAQGMLQNAMEWLKPYIRGLQQADQYVRWILQIHDEIILEGTADLMRETIDPLVKEALTEHLGIAMIVPVKCSGGLELTWGDL